MIRKRWSELQKALDQLRAPLLNKRFQIHCQVYSTETNRSLLNKPRYWIALDQEILRDFPKDFAMKGGDLKGNALDGSTVIYPYDIHKISDILRVYLNTDIEHVKEIPDAYGLVEILYASDRRVGKRKCKAMMALDPLPAVKKIIEARLMK